MEPTFLASLSKGRQKWCAIFRHPLIPDKSTGKPGLRVRRGLGTDNRNEAQGIVDDLNLILSNKDFWQLGARELASRQFNLKAVSAFYDHDRLRTVLVDPWEKRNEVLPLPGDGYSVAQIVGPFGVGKTTLLRQLIGTDPKKERFPSTSKGKTTTCDTEIICAAGQYSAVVSFLSRDRVRGYTEECVEAAVSAAAEGLSDNLIARNFLEHNEQRFRLAYVLGKFCGIPNQSEDGDEDTDEEVDAEGDEDVNTSGAVSEQERQENAQKLVDWIAKCKAVAASVISALEEEIGESAEELSHKDKDAFLELVDERLQESEPLQDIVDQVLEAVEERFNFIQAGLDKDNSGWPIRWQMMTSDRQEFLRQVNQFSGNYEKHFGRLLAPLVDGIRVKGPFKPTGSNEIPSLVLLDGEGLGHVTSTATSVPTAVTRRFGIAHTILLVDTAERAMDAGPKALLRCVVASGHDRKLAVVFTHFDQMRSDAFANSQDKQNHVQSSLEQAIVSLDETLDSQTGASRRVRKHLAGRVFFVGRINEAIDEKSKASQGTRKALSGLVRLMVEAGRPEVTSDTIPCYDLAYLYPGIHKATDTFQQDMNMLLQTEHWKRIEALTRRFAKQWSDEYKHIKPVARLSELLRERLALFWATPKTWRPANCTQEIKDAVIQKVTREFSSRLDAYVSRRFREDHLNAWSAAYGWSGRGSGRKRSNDVRGIDEDVAPVPSEQRASKLFDDIRQLCREAIIAAGGEVTVS